MLFSLFDETGYAYLNIELGKNMVINYLNKFYFTNKKYELNKDLLGLIYNFGRIFNYSNVIIYHNYNSFNQFENNYSKESTIFLSYYLFNYSIYNYIKFNKKFIDIDPFITYKVGYWYLDNYFNKAINNEIINQIPDDLKLCKNNKELLIKLIENYFYLYHKIIELMDYNIFSNTYVIFNIYEKLLSENLIENFKPDLDYTINKIKDDNFNLIYKQPIRRR